MAGRSERGEIEAIECKGKGWEQGALWEKGENSGARTILKIVLFREMIRAH